MSIMKKKKSLWPRETHVLFVLCALLGIFVNPSDGGLDFTTLPDIKSIGETTATSTTIYTVAFSNGTAPYTCTISNQNPNDATRQASFTGLNVVTILAFDYETTTQFILTIECTDSLSDSGTSTLTVDIADENDEIPVISGTLNANFNEESSVGTAVTGLFTAADADAVDAGALSYALTGSDTSYFQIDASGGTISVKTILDRDAVSARIVFNQLTLVVTDLAGASATASLTVTLLDTNDNTPTFAPATYYASVAEDTGTGQTIETFTCNDPDETPGNGDITYAIASGDDASPKFTISGNEIHSTANAIDYEALSGQSYKYTLIITGTDGGATPKTGTATVIVQVTSVNDADPVWAAFTPAYTSATTPYDINESVTQGTTVITIAATDADHGADGVVTYSIVSTVDNSLSSTPGIFRIDPAAGTVMTDSLLDRDPLTGGVTFYDLVVRATDGGMPSRSVDRTVRVGLLDVNDNTPAFAQSLYQVSMSEDQAATTSVLALAATDKDVSSTIAYSILSGNTGSKFQISAGNELQIQTAIDLDSPSNDADQYSLVIRVVDGGGPELTGSTTVAVTITATNDHDPVFGATTPGNTVQIPESTSVGGSLATVAATDNDYGAHGTISFTISSGDTGNNFQLNADSGVIKLSQQIDYDTLGTNPIELAILATDGGGRMDTATVTVSVTDSNDHTPSCISTALSASVNEDESIGYNVMTLSCSDLDSSDTLAYSITSGNTGTAFSITPSGLLQLNAAVDYDAGTTIYYLVIRVSDGTNNEDVQVTVSIEPINEAAPSFSPNSVSVQWPEDTPTSTTLATFTATDTDSGTDGTLTYAITAVSNSGSSLFLIDAVNGEVKLVQELDYEALPAATKYYTITVTATDGGGSTDTGTVTVSVTDVNDNQPSCTPTAHPLSQAENTAAGSLPLAIIASLGCTDADDGALGTLSYTLAQTPTGSQFAVHSTTGVVTLTTALNYEAVSSYSLLITIKDGDTPTPKSTTVTVVVSVTNLNDGAPSFSGTFADTIPESDPIGQPVHDVTASDPDDSNTPEGELVYSILSGDTNNQFTIDSATGRVSVNKELDREATASYLLVVQAIEAVGTNSASRTLTVTISDVNDNSPSCTVTALGKSILENAAVNDVITTFACTDADDTAFGTVTYSITSGDTTKFKIVGSDLAVKAAVDYDSGTRSYDLVIRASDGTNTEDVSVSVTLDPVNEAAPVFTSAGVYNVDVFENTLVGGLVETVTATDADSADTSDGQVQYSFVSTYPNFHIDSISGKVIVQSSLDRETTPAFTLLVQGTDGTNTVTATVSVTVTDVNDNPPVFTAYTYSGSVSESDTTGYNVATVSAPDNDDPSTADNGAVVYSITAGNTGGYFIVHSTSGVVTTTAAIDYDVLASPAFSLTIVAKDKNGGAGALSATAIVSVTVTNVNDNSPTFTSATYNTNVLEDTTLGTSLTQAVANDADAGVDGDVVYTMASHAKFQLDQATGEVTLKDHLDYETDTSYTFDIVATDKGTSPQSATATVYITVDDANDETPICNPAAVSITKREDQSTPNTIATLSCTDADSGTNGALTYTIISVNAVAGNGPFQAMSGSALVLNSALDYETTSLYNVLISVVDGGTSAKSTTATVALAVSDVNEQDPAFSGTPYSKNVAEGMAVGNSVFQVVTTDADTADTVSYVFNPASTVFSIDPQTGEITVKAPLDREAVASYTLTVVATDSGTVDAVRSSTENVAITITDINDNSPVFSPGSYSDTLAENTATNVIVLSLTATDQDATTNGVITYSLQSGNTGNVFRVEKDIPSGECRLIVDDTTSLDFDTVPSFSLVVRATDGGGLATDAPVTLQITGYNDFTPFFSPSSSSTETVPEDSTVNTVVIDLNAMDADSGADGTLTYSIVSGSSGKFAIDPSTGVVTVSGTLDRETTTSYPITVHAIDGGTSPSAKTGTYSLTVQVSDVNDNTPVCTRSDYSDSMSENTAPSVSISQVSCSDSDTDSPNNVLVYSITGGTGSALFDIGSASGEVSTATGSNFDREAKASYTLIVQASDQGTSALAIAVNMVITITDENDNDPQFCCSPYSTSVLEDAAVDTSFFQVVATDADIAPASTVIYSIASGNTGNKFTIDGNTGDIRTTASLDRETLASYDLAIHATDLGGTPRTGTATVSITVSDTNDNAPACTASFYPGSVAENAATTDPVATVSCSDADLGANAVVSYTILDAAVPFTIGTSSGIVSVSAALDAETTTSYTLTIMASDGVLSSNVIVGIDVTDVNEAAPAFSPSGPYTVNVNEDEAIGYTVEIINATDSDISDTTDSLIFSISGGNTANTFGINPSSGVVRTNSALDYETTTVYLLEITIEDGTDAGKLSSTTTLTVSILDLNDNAPVCSPEIYVETVNETDTGTVVTVTCTDADTVSPTLTYTISSGNTNSDFSIIGATGVLSISSNLDYENTASYDLTIGVTDGTLSNIARISITVVPINEHDPVFTAGSYGTNVAEDTTPGTSILQVDSTDQDSGTHGTPRYSIVSGNTDGKFIIEESTGIIRIASMLDREQTASNPLVIRVSDSTAGASDARTASPDVTATITVDDVNDNYPVFTPVSYVKDVAESAASGATVARVTASDDDAGVNSNLLYSITAGNTAGIFSMSGDYVTIAGGQNLDYETQTFHSLTVKAVDQGASPKSSFASVSIQVVAVNEFTPTFPANSSQIIAEDTAVGTVIFTAASSDNDAGSDGDVVYSFIAGNSPGTPFLIDTTTGGVQVWAILDFDTAPQSYSLEILAQDNSGTASGLSSTMTLDVTLTDVNDETPIFALNTYTFNVAEDVSVSTSVGAVLANDADSEVNGQVTYSLVTGDGVGVFTVNSITGQVDTDAAASLDFETKTQYSLVVRATDGGSPQLTSQCLVKFVVTDINDNAPVFQPVDFTVTILEDVGTSTSITTVVATDADSGVNAVFTYSVFPSTHFAVDATSGVISTTAALDRETSAVHTLTVKALDQGTPAQAGTATVTVLLGDVNDNPPVVTGTYDTSLQEDTGLGTVVFSVTATDADDGVNALLTYNITSGNTNTDWEIEQASGIFQVSNVLDRESTTDYHVVVTVTDGGTPQQSASITLSLTITDVNDNNPVFTSTPYTFNIDENVPTGSSAGRITATDADTGVNAALQYQLVIVVSGSPHFAVNPANGDITTTASLDRETFASYIVRCRVKDNGTPSLSSVIDVNVAINDLNDNTPVYSTLSYSGSVTENSVIGTSVLTVIATDIDIGANAALTLSIDTLMAGGARADQLLAVDSATGIISAKQVIDRETDATLTFELLATDGGVIPLTGTTTVTVSITDENDNAPIFTSLFMSLEKVYDSRCTNFITTVTANDLDQGSNRLVSYYLVQSINDYLFAVDESTGEVTTKATAVTNTKYVIYVMSRDNGVTSQVAANNIALRIDAFDPTVNSISFILAVSKDYYLANEQSFIDDLTSVYNTRYPTAVVRRWCLEETLAGSAVDPAKRRRLLATGDQPVTVHLYVLANNDTDSIANIGNSKTFLTASEALSFVTSSSDGSPSAAITGSGWSNYSITQVVLYETPTTTTSTPWAETPTGIAVIVCSIIGFLLLIALIVLIVCFCKKRRGSRPVTPVRPMISELKEPKPMEEKNNKQPAPVPPRHHLLMPNIGQDDLKKQNQKPSVFALPMPQPEKPVNSDVLKVDHPETRYPVVNRQFDGMAVDPASGKLYEYNTRTNERRWMSTRDGKAITVNELNRRSGSNSAHPHADV